MITRIRENLLRRAGFLYFLVKAPCSRRGTKHMTMAVLDEHGLVDDFGVDGRCGWKHCSRQCVSIWERYCVLEDGGCYNGLIRGSCLRGLNGELIAY